MHFLSVKSQKLKVNGGLARGFTVIETLVAIIILLIALTAPLTIAEKGLASAEVARQEITAFYLAQEAVEYMRNARDANALAGQGGSANWLQGLNQCTTAAGCGVDTTASPGQQIVGCASNDDCTLYRYTGSVELFGHRTTSGWERTGFTRKVYLAELVNGAEASTTVRVDFVAGALGSRSIILSEHLFNWYVSP